MFLIEECFSPLNNALVFADKDEFIRIRIIFFFLKTESVKVIAEFLAFWYCILINSVVLYQ